MREIPEGEEGEQDGGTAFDDEEVTPILERSALDLEGAVGEKPSESRGDTLCRIEDGEPSSKFTATVESAQVSGSAEKPPE